MKKIKIALIIRGFHHGGIEKVFENYFSHMDLSLFEIHIITHMKNDPVKKKIFTDMGCRIHEFSKLHGHKLTFQNIKEYRKFFSKNQFDIVHNNMPENLLPLWFAKRKKVSCRILHSHNIYTAGYEKKNPVVARLYMFGFYLNTRNATILIGASKIAAQSVFGEKNMNDVIILHNAIEAEKYRFRPAVSIRMRKELNVEGKFVIGHIGRYTGTQKNQEFVLNVFREFFKQQKKSHLLMIGDGERLNEFMEQAEKMGIGNNVTFTGNVLNVPDFLQAMDVFILPSRKEGLGIAAVEAQAAGLYCLVSAQVPDEARVTENIEFLSIDNGVDRWVEALNRKKDYVKADTLDEIRACGYEIEICSRSLSQLYLGSIE